MSLANKLGNIYTDLNTALNNVNSTLVEKGVSTASTIYDISDQIRAIENKPDNEFAINLIEGDLADLVLPEGLTSIRPYFYINLVEETAIRNLIIPNTVTKIGLYAFAYNTKLETAIIFGNIEESVFTGCTSLINITLGNNINKIDNRAFERCTSLTSVTIPDSVTSIGLSVFDECSSLTTMYLKPTTPPILDSANAISTATTTIYVPIGCKSAYEVATNWSSFADIITEIDMSTIE